MTEHERARELAAIALDFPLEAAERVELDTHLDTCDPCRAFVAGLSGDHAALAALPRIDAPDRVRRAVQSDRPVRPRGSASPLVAALVVAVLTVVPLGAGALLFGGFGGSPGAGATTAPARTPGVRTPAPPSPSPSPTASPAASAAPR